MNHHISNDNLRVVVSEYGSELQSIRSKDQIEYLWQGDPAYWSGRAPTIFPYVGRLQKALIIFRTIATRCLFTALHQPNNLAFQKRHLTA